MVWGLVLEPLIRYTQEVKEPILISQAAMDISTGNKDPCQLMMIVEGKLFLVCTLQKDECIQVPLSLYLRAGDSLTFFTTGTCNIHLLGYMNPKLPSVPTTRKRKRRDVIDASNDVTANNKKAKQDKKADNKPAAAGDASADASNMTLFTHTSDKKEFDVEEEDAEDCDDEETLKGSSEEADTTLETSMEEKMDMSKHSSTPQVYGVDKSKKEKQDGQQKADKKKEGKKEKADAQTRVKKEKKSLICGVRIQDLKVGNGPVAEPGKIVMVYFVGRLKKTNKIFKSCLKGPGLTFHLGANEVISGLDVGISGMMVGGRRRIICPPAMAYGAKGLLPWIPPNKTIVFELELKSVK